MSYVHVLRSVADDGNTLQTNIAGIRREPEFFTRTFTTDSGELDSKLKPFQALDHSWEAAVERVLNRVPVPAGVDRPITLRDHQVEAVEALVSALENGAPGFHANLPTGAGKTIIGIEAMRRHLAGWERVPRILVLAPLAAHAAWRRDLRSFGTGGAEWILINPQRLPNLVCDERKMDSASERLDYFTLEDMRVKNEAAASHGVPLLPFDVVIMDESHLLVNADRVRARIWRRLIGWSEDGDRPQVPTIALSATSFSKPEETSVSAHLLAYRTGLEVPSSEVFATSYTSWLSRALDTPVHASQPRFSWKKAPQVQERLSELLFDGVVGYAATASDLGLPVQERRVHAVTFTAKERREFDMSWPDFASEADAGEWYRRADEEFETLEERASRADAPHELTRQLRGAQKASAIRVPYIVDLVIDQVYNGYQVIVPAWLTATAAQIHKELCARGIPTANLIAAQVKDARARETEIREFQSGEKLVIVTTVQESISLHEGQAGGGVGGEDASLRPRITVMADVLTGGKRAYQAEGRGTRDGAHAPVVYVYAEDTVEERWTINTLRNLSNTAALTSAGDSDPDEDPDASSFLRLAREIEDRSTTRP